MPFREFAGKMGFWRIAAVPRVFGRIKRGHREGLANGMEFIGAYNGAHFVTASTACSVASSHVDTCQPNAPILGEWIDPSSISIRRILVTHQIHV